MPACPPVSDLFDAAAADDVPAALERHLSACTACRGILAAIREESAGVSFSVAELWMKERISCPHSDILLAHANGALTQEEAGYIAFHLDTVDCPHCQAEYERLKELVQRKSPRRLEKALDESLRKSAVFIGESRRSGRK